MASDGKFFPYEPEKCRAAIKRGLGRFVGWLLYQPHKTPSPGLLKQIDDLPVATYTMRDRPTMPWETDPRDSEVVVGLPNRSLTVTMREPADNRLTRWCDSGDDIADHYAGRCKCIPVATVAKIAAAV